jgi:hypothetical protein
MGFPVSAAAASGIGILHIYDLDYWPQNVRVVLFRLLDDVDGFCRVKVQSDFGSLIAGDFKINRDFELIAGDI